MSINWNLSQGNGFGNALAMGMQFGQQIRQRREQKEAQERETQGRNALASYASSGEGMEAAMQYDPRATMAIRGDMQNQQAQEANQRRADVPMLANLLGHAAKGEQQWNEAMSLAQQYGIDVSGVPQQFDPEWAQGQAQTMKLLQTPEGQEALSAAGKQAVDMGFRPGTPEFQTKVTEIWQQNGAIPYTDAQGATRLYIPGGQSSGPEPGAVVGGYRFKGGDPNDRGNWEQVGGSGGNAGGGFPSGQ